MTAFYDDLSGFGAFEPVHPHNALALSPEVTLSDSGILSPIGKSTGHGGGHSGGGGGTAPAATLVSATGSNLLIDLVWDSSVANAPSGFMSALIASAAALVTDLSAAVKTELYIAVGWGEIAGQNMSPSALGESESNGYLTTYATVANALTAHGDNVTASNEPPASTQFFVTSAEAKLLGMISPTSGSASSVDGYIGFSTLSGLASWNFGATGTTGAQYNLQAVALHEFTEVMGRISMEGTTTYYGQKTYTPLDLFDYSAANTLALSNTGGYFSNDNGQSNLGNFNDAAVYNGDIADWASYNSTSESGTVTSGQDPFNAFGRPGYDVQLPTDDLLEMSALGYTLTGQALA